MEFKIIHNEEEIRICKALEIISINNTVMKIYPPFTDMWKAQINGGPSLVTVARDVLATLN